MSVLKNAFKRHSGSVKSAAYSSVLPQGMGSMHRPITRLPSQSVLNEISALTQGFSRVITQNKALMSSMNPADVRVLTQTLRTASTSSQSPKRSTKSSTFTKIKSAETSSPQSSKSAPSPKRSTPKSAPSPKQVSSKSPATSSPKQDSLKSSAAPSSKQSSSKPPATPSLPKSRRGRRIAAALATALMCIYIYNHYIDPVVPEQAPKFNIVPAPQTAFQHPLNDSSTLYTAYFYVTRMMELGWAFLPFIGYTLALLLTGGITEARRGRWMEVLVQCIEKSGCAFLKFGQWLSMRPDIFPLDVINVLARLRDNAPSHRFRDTVRIVEEEFQAPIAEVFDEFPSEPVASGSIAQVYKCRLTEAWAVKAGMLDANGDLIRDVAVKVRHPKVMNETWIDVDLIYAAIALTPQLCIPFSKEEFRNMMQNQIDFRWEAHFLSRFASNFSDEIAQRFIDFPRVSNALLREAVLVESWAEGRSVSDIFTEVGDMFRPINEAAKLNERQIDRSDVELGAFLARKAKQAGKFIKDEVEDGLHWALKKLGFDVDRFYTKQHLRVGEDRYVYDASLTPEENNVRAKKKVLAFTLFDMYLKMFLRDNLIHGDLHAGNVLFNMNNHVATVLDAGMTVSLEGDIMSKFGFFLKAICEGDADLLIKHVKEFEVNLPGLPKGSGHGKLSAYPEVLDSFSRNIHEIFEKFYKKSVYGNEIPEQVSIGDVVGQVLLALEKEKLEIRGDVASAILSMSVIEGILRQLDPDLDIILKSVVYFMKYKEVTDFGTILK